MGDADGMRRPGLTKLGGADRRVVSWMREQAAVMACQLSYMVSGWCKFQELLLAYIHCPGALNPLVPIDRALGGVCPEVWHHMAELG